MEPQVLELKKQLEDENLSPEQKVTLLNNGLNKALNAAAVQTSSSVLISVKSQLYRSGVLRHCVRLLSLDPRTLRSNWSAVASLAQLTSSCCVGAELGEQSQAFHRLFLPSVMDALLSLASQLMRQSESLFRKVMDSVGWLLRAHTQLTTQVLSSAHYERIQMCDDVKVSLLCVQMWIQTCTASSDFLSGLSDDSVLLLLNEAVGQLAVSSEPVVGGASVKLILLMANQLQRRLQHLLRSFRGLDSLLDKDWRGRGFDEDLDQLITLIQTVESTVSAERVRAACVIQAAWRSFQTRRRVKSLNRAVSTLQRRYRARRRQQQQQKEAQQWEEELRYQVCVRRQQARREFHQKQRQLLQLLPADQVQSYLQECERRAAVVIQSFWRGFRERRRYNTQRHTLRRTHTQRQAASTLQRAVRRFLERRRASKAPPTPTLWIGQSGLTDSRRAELKRQVEDYIAVHPSSRTRREECERLHEEVQLLLLAELQRGEQHRREEQRREALPSGPVSARARDSHNATLQASRLPWWRTLGDVAASPAAPLQELEEELGGLNEHQTAEGAPPLRLPLPAPQHHTGKSFSSSWFREEGRERLFPSCVQPAWTRNNCKENNAGDEQVRAHRALLQYFTF
ncbi:IQ calmodulin-binding motif-containing protein 1-like isoform X1 [Scomber scombrus]|uniref:IQ calmodulin-binding motif-containing protein 1-like isoform X1 n=1 Tax=Scomber scombrus TaxID=13677 RepID=A0AAV1Q5G6_SCOSC